LPVQQSSDPISEFDNDPGQARDFTAKPVIVSSKTASRSANPPMLVYNLANYQALPSLFPEAFLLMLSKQQFQSTHGQYFN